MSDLDQKEQTHVRAALHFLRLQMGGYRPLCKALRADDSSLRKVIIGEKEVSASVALRVARLLDVPFDDLLLGSYRPGACTKCGHRPGYLPVYESDFKDEHTATDSGPRSQGAALSLVP